MANTAMSDSGAMPSPTVVTVAVLPRRASASRNGGSAASSCVRPSSSGIGSSARPSRQTYRSPFTASPVLDDQGEVLGVQARTAYERPVDLGVLHEVTDVP